MSNDKTPGSALWKTTNPQDLQKEYVGPNYEYAKFIKTPNEMGMSGKSNAIASNISGLMNYIHLLSEGGGPASKNYGLPLGNRYFLNMGGKCKTPAGDTVSRSLYVNNIADGKIPFLQNMGIDLSSFKGLIPAILGDVNKLDPTRLFAAFNQPSTPPCRNIYMKTVDENNIEGTGSGFVADNDIQGIAPCAFVEGVNPITGEICTESFVGNKSTKQNIKGSVLKNKPIANIYTALVSFLMLYITYKFVYKKH
jgi:hypothetical protein